jgi:type I restriction enzyme, S subunit
VSDKNNRTLKASWRRVKFGDVVRLSKARSQDPLTDGIERYVGLEHLEPGDLRVRSWGNVADGVTFTSVFQPGQVLFGKRRAYQRKVAVADFSGVCSGDIYVLETKDAQALLPELLPFICQTDAFFDHAVGTSAGSLSPRTNWTSLADFEFWLPQIEEQKQISALFKSVEAAKESYVMALNTALRLRDSLIQDAQINAAKIKLGNVCTIQGGYAFKSSDFCTSGIPLIRISNIQDGLVDVTDDTPRLPHKHLSQTGKFLLRNGDLLMALSGATTGKTGVYKGDQPALLNQRVARFGLVDENVIEPYLLNELVSQASNKVLSLAAGSAQPNISTRDLELIEVAIPPISVQHELVKLLRNIDISAETLRQRKNLLQQMQKRVLP